MRKRILLAIVRWLIQYVDDHHVARNGGKRKKEIGETINMNADGEIV